ncbi:MAG: L,D-transpeptidase [bacterium]
MKRPLLVGLSALTLLIFAQLPTNAVEQKRGGMIHEPVVERVVIGLEEFQLLAYDERGRLLFHFPVTIGADTGPTPTGHFKITSRLRHPWYTPEDEETLRPGHPENPLGSRWLGINKPHYGLHGTNEPETIRTKDSEGCVRLRNRDIEKLYRHLPRGADVIIKRRLDLKRENLRTVKHKPESQEENQGG